MSAHPFTIEPMATHLGADAALYRETFARGRYLHFENGIAPAFLATLLSRAAAARFIDDDVEYVGRRQIEAPQTVGGMLSEYVGTRPRFQDHA